MFLPLLPPPAPLPPALPLPFIKRRYGNYARGGSEGWYKVPYTDHFTSNEVHRPLKSGSDFLSLPLWQQETDKWVRAAVGRGTRKASPLSQPSSSSLSSQAQQSEKRAGRQEKRHIPTASDNDKITEVVDSPEDSDDEQTLPSLFHALSSFSSASLSPSVSLFLSVCLSLSPFPICLCLSASLCLCL